MLRVSRIVGLFARGITQEAGTGAIADFRTGEADNDISDIAVSDISEDTRAGVALTPVAHNASPNVVRRSRLASDRRSSSSGPLAAPRDPRVRLIQNQCVKISLNLFNRSDPPTRSLGFTSAIPGEGKTLLASATAIALAERGRRPVTLLDCNWDNPTLHTRFDLPHSPGLAEWLRRECDLADIRHTISPHLTVIPSGDASDDALALTDRFRGIGGQAILTAPDEVLVADLPAVLTTDYGAQLPQLLDAVLLVVRAGVTQEAYIAEANRELADSPLEGAVLNATRSYIPRWLQRLL